MADKQVLGEGPLVVNPLSMAVESGSFGHADNFLGPVLVRAFRPDRLALVEH